MSSAKSELFDSEKNAGSIEESEGTTMNVSKEFLEVLKFSKELVDVMKRFRYHKKIVKQISSIETRLDKLYNKVIKSKNAQLDDIFCLAQAYLYIGEEHINLIEKEKSYIKEQKFLTKCLELLKDKEQDRKAILIVITATMQLARVNYVVNNRERYKSTMHKAAELYLIYTKGKDNYLHPIEICSVLDIKEKDNTRDILESMHVTILENFSTMYCANVDEATIYLCAAVNKELHLIHTKKSFINWAIKSLRLARQFWFRRRFTEARNYLIAADFIIQKYCREKCADPEMDAKTDSEMDAKTDPEQTSQNDYKFGTYTVALSWAKYGVELLRLSREKLLQNKEDNEDSEEYNLESEPLTKYSEQQPTKLLIFAKTEMELEEFIPPITDKYFLDYKNAKAVSDSILKWFEEAMVYYTPEKSINKYVNIIQFISKVYKYFACYEQDILNQIKLHNIRINKLKEGIKILNPNIHPTYCKNIWIELALTYSTILDLITEFKNMPNKINLKELDETIEPIVQDSIHNLQLFSKFHNK